MICSKICPTLKPVRALPATPASTTKFTRPGKVTTCAARIQPSAASNSTAGVGLQQPEPQKRLCLISAISASVEIQARTQRFETFAGRSAMVGVLVALVAELLTEHSIFTHISSDTAASLSALFMGAVSLAAAAAVASKRRMGVELLEAVITSLTANQRSAASVTGCQVDTAVDSVLNKVFNQGVIYSIIAQEEDF